MHKTFRALALIFALLLPTAAKAQQFPSIPDHSVIGRIGITGQSGPSQAISFSLLSQTFLNGICKTNNAFLVYSTASAAWVCSTAPSANTVYAGPSTAPAAQPTFRALVGADLPNPSASTLGGVESLAAVSHNFLTSISTSGVPAQAQPAFSDVSGNIATSQMNSGTNAGATTYWRGDATWVTAVSSAQISAGSGVSVATTAGANPCVTTCNLTVSANNSMGANKLQVFSTAGGSGTITTPTGAAWAKFTLIGGGAGAGGSGTGAGGSVTAGGNTCINTSGAACTSPVYQAGGGNAGDWSNGGTGGTCSGSGSFLLSQTGGDGQGQSGAATASSGYAGGFGGEAGLGYGHGGAAGRTNQPGANGSGFGGGGQGGGTGTTASVFSGSGGGGGAGCIAFVQSPASSYTYAVANTASGGTAGTSGTAGGAGSGGLIIAEFGFN